MREKEGIEGGKKRDGVGRRYGERVGWREMEWEGEREREMEQEKDRKGGDKVRKSCRT